MKVLIKKFKTVEGKEIQIPATIRGGNGLGKSTILEAISFVFTGVNLNGKEFQQIYDNRVDLHDAIADVSFFDDYGNEWNRIVKPIFQTGRDGIESIKIKRSTECRKNGIPCNDFSDEFSDFYKFGTDFIFCQKESDQRQIFIDLLKSKLPVFDVSASSLKLKELTKAQKLEVIEIKEGNASIKAMKDVEVPTIPTDLQKSNDEYLKLQNSYDSEAVAAINKVNNKASELYFEQKSKLNNSIQESESKLGKSKKDDISIGLEIKALKESEYSTKKKDDIEPLKKEIEELKTNLAKLTYYETINDYALQAFQRNPICVQNQQRITEIIARVFEPSIETNSACPLSGEVCETARLNSEKSQRVLFETQNTAEIDTLKAQNRSILSNEMNGLNEAYLSLKSKLTAKESVLLATENSNSKVDQLNKDELSLFENKKALDIKTKTAELKHVITSIKEESLRLELLQKELDGLKEPTPEKLPEALKISEELKKAHADFTELEKSIIGANAINENNAKNIEELQKEITKKQAYLLEIGENIAKLTAEITDYFSNVKGIIQEEFKGDIDIDVELLEYVMARDEYKDCFKITANGKVFPYECNGALQNNVKMQILFNLQRLAKYSGVTILDNAESNTTQEVKTHGLNCILAYATNDNELIIK